MKSVLRLTVFDVLGKSLLEKVADVTNNAKQCPGGLKRDTFRVSIEGSNY